MRRPTNHTRYDILTSAEAWSLIGTLGAEEFASVQAEIEKLAWSAFTLWSQAGGASSRLNVTTDTVSMLCEVDHAAHRVTVLTLSRGLRGLAEAGAAEGGAPSKALREPKASGGAGKKR